MGAVRGDLILWARAAHALTMRAIRERGGPCLGYQSEVEHGKKTEIHSDVLLAWVDVLGITEPFARGQIVPYFEDPKACKGLARDVMALIQSPRFDHYNWSELSCLERVQQVLRLIAYESKHLPRVVLSYVLGIGLDTMDGLLNGIVPPTKEIQVAIQDLTDLPAAFFKFGQVDVSENERYMSVIRIAKEQSVSPEDLLALIKLKDLSLSDLVKRGVTPEEALLPFDSPVR